MNKPLVSVRLMTFNHEPFIKEAMDGIFNQKTTFNVEVVVGDDFSSDNTLEIIKEYKDTDNIKLKILKRTKGDEYWKYRQKYGRLYNFTDILAHCNGKYIALLDGDDYWTDPLKLQKQVDFLESNNEFSICFHKVNILKGAVLKPDYITKVPDKVSDINDLAKGNYIHTVSCLFRNNPMKIKHLEKYSESKVGDYILHLYSAKEGKIKYIDEEMAIYRVHENGVLSKLNEYQKLKNIHYYLYLLIQSGDFLEIEEHLVNRFCSITWNLIVEGETQKESEIHLGRLTKISPDFLLEKIKHLSANASRGMKTEMKRQVKRVLKKMNFS